MSDFFENLYENINKYLFPVPKILVLSPLLLNSTTKAILNNLFQDHPISHYYF